MLPTARAKAFTDQKTGGLHEKIYSLIAVRCNHDVADRM